jgi:outer membrane receptor protein involved in Fe transport
MDKNENFDYLLSPAASLVYSKTPTHVWRLSLSSAIRNPTLADQYLYYNVGRATLLGNIDGQFEEGRDSLFTIASLNAYRNSPSLLQGLNKLDYFNVDRLRPEKVKTLEIGYRGTWFKNTYIDVGYYYSIYEDFIGYVIGLNAKFNQVNGFPEGGINAYRVAANAIGQVTTQGLNFGVNYFFRNTTISANYSWNKLLSGDEDPIIPAFNTPEHKFNLGLSARNLSVFNSQRNFGYGINYKWMEGFIFEGSPQFTGPIETYDMVDAQVNVYVPKIKSTIKFGGSNIFGVRPFFSSEYSSLPDKLQRAISNENIQVYGGPAVGRILYVQILFDLQKAP